MAAKWSRLFGLGYFGSGLICATAVSTIFANSKEKQECIEPETVTNTDGSTPRPIPIPTPFDNKVSQIKEINSQEYQLKLRNSIERATDLCTRAKDEYGLPGLVIGVSVNGKTIWDEGFGYADLENRLEMGPKAILRIASISKSMTMAMMAKLMEEGKINIDCPIQTYLPDYPQKQVDGKDVVITTRDLLSHLSGIRHYLKKGEKEDENEMTLAEYFFKDKFETVEKSMELFQNDELIHEPGVKFHYTTHGWTVVSAIVEKITETAFPKHAQNIFKHWGLTNTYLDEHEPIIYHRARYYTRDKKSQLIKNSPYVDNSYKWAGGGFLSSVGDLKQFAHIMIASLQNPWHDTNFEKSSVSNQPYLKENTMQQVWTGDARTVKPNTDFLYGLGFYVQEPLRKCLFCKERKLMTVLHTGGAIGSSAVLLMTFPQCFRFGYEVDVSKTSTVVAQDVPESEFSGNNAKAVVVAMMTNMTGVGLSKTALEIADLFEWLI